MNRSGWEGHVGARAAPRCARPLRPCSRPTSGDGERRGETWQTTPSSRRSPIQACAPSLARSSLVPTRQTCCQPAADERRLHSFAKVQQLGYESAPHPPLLPFDSSFILLFPWLVLQCLSGLAQRPEPSCETLHPCNGRWDLRLLRGSLSPHPLAKQTSPLRHRPFTVSRDPLSRPE